MMAKASATPTAANAGKAQQPKKQSKKKRKSLNALVKKATAKPTATMEAPAKQIPKGSALVKQINAKKAPSQLPTRTCPPIPVRDQQRDQAASIWTAATSQSFYTNVNTLSKKLNQRQTPRVAENYRITESQQCGNSREYTLAYEEELHLADHFAFLAQNSEGPEFVSAVTVEESGDPPCFTVRLASNHTPTPEVRNGLENILKVVRDHAHKGRHRDEYKTRLFDEVVRFCQKRIYGRLRCSKWEKPASFSGSNPAPLHAQIKALLSRLGADSLKSTLIELIASLKRVDRGPTKDQIELLKEVIRRSYAVSHQGKSKSLETILQAMGLGTAIYQSREVLEIDKLSKYLELCEDLIRLSRQSSTCALCQGLKLEVLQSYPSTKPLGSLSKCHVHGEVQLVLYYEQYPTHPTPRAIGSSKSACFLCDLFIRKHGGFGISHSHMKLYPMWTIPEVSWMNAQQRTHFQGLIQDMTLDIQKLLKVKLYHCGAVIESRAHILQIVQRSELASSIASPSISEPQLAYTSRLRMPMTDSFQLNNSTLGQVASTLYYFQDLPITVSISVSSVSCTLLAGKVDYIFDLEEIKSGLLFINECGGEERASDDARVDVRELSISPKCLRTQSQNLTFHVHDADKHELRVSMTWDTPLE